MKTNLETYAAEMSQKIKESGLDCCHWSEVSMVIDELLKYSNLKGDTGSNDICFVGFTNGANIKLLKDTDYGAMYSNTNQNCYIPLYMLRSHLDRIELTSNGSITAESIGMRENDS